MITGTVKSFDIVYGSGFVTPDDGSKDVYVMHSAIECEGLQALKKGQRVSVEIDTGFAYRVAKRVQVLHPEDALVLA